MQHVVPRAFVPPCFALLCPTLLSPGELGRLPADLLPHGRLRGAAPGHALPAERSGFLRAMAVRRPPEVRECLEELETQLLIRRFIRLEMYLPSRLMSMSMSRVLRFRDSMPQDPPAPSSFEEGAPDRFVCLEAEASCAFEAEEPPPASVSCCAL